ncbi:pyridine nucleotide-disulfide oxidoreductase [Salinisphaera sp. PC39]|uniref:FAD-dependent oxidoreductase n=1 Tax=Salinisphaera sp. PC39 TaxID=1304156 RepID=UPI00333F7943
MTGRPTILLVGAGHAHLHVAARAAEFVRRGARLLLLDPGHFWYSGMATGVLGGRYPSSADRLDPAALVRAAGGDFLAGRVVGVDAERQVAHLADGGALGYDRLSLNVGSEVAALPAGAAGDPDVWPVKPVANLRALHRAVRDRLADGTARLEVVVAGGGASGCEVAANLAALGRSCAGSLRVSLCARGDRLLPAAPAPAARRLASHLARLGVAVLTGAEVAAKDGGTLRLADGRRLRADLLAVATGLRAAPLTRATGLPWDERGGLRVTAALHSEADARVFAAGDCAHFLPRPLPKLGVYGVRAAPVLHRNLLASLDGRALRAYRPQTRHLAILNLGDGTGLATWSRLWWHGRAAMRLKDRIDRKFMAGYRAIYSGRVAGSRLFDEPQRRTEAHRDRKA